MHLLKFVNKIVDKWHKFELFKHMIDTYNIDTACINLDLLEFKKVI